MRRVGSVEEELEEEARFIDAKPEWCTQSQSRPVGWISKGWRWRKEDKLYSANVGTRYRRCSTYTRSTRMIPLSPPPPREGPVVRFELSYRDRPRVAHARSWRRTCLDMHGVAPAPASS